jgi:hypothetical protein
MRNTILLLTMAAILSGGLCIALAQQTAPPAKIPNAAEEQLKQQPQLLPAQNALAGRYQATYAGSAGHFILVDTHTGQCWERHTGQPKFRDLGSPVTVKE